MMEVSNDSVSNVVPPRHSYRIDESEVDYGTLYIILLRPSLGPHKFAEHFLATRSGIPMIRTIDHAYLTISGFPLLSPSLATFGGSGVQNSDTTQ